jgi:hypothetical protein
MNSETKDSLIRLHQELIDLVDKKLSTVNSVTLLCVFWSFVLVKAIKTQRAIILLCQNGLGEDAFMLDRTLFELMIISYYINLDESGERLRRYVLYDHITRQQMYSYIGMAEELVNDPRATPKIFAEIEKNSNEAKKEFDYGTRRAWSDKSIENMAREVGRWEAYKTVYKLQCILSHSEARSMNEYIKDDGDGFLIDLSPNENYIVQSLVSSFDFMYHILLGAFSVYKWDTSELKDIEQKYLEAVKIL